MKRGDIHWANLPLPSAGNNTHVQQGRRPAIIVQSDEARTFTVGTKVHPFPTVTIVPLTTQARSQVFPGAFMIRPSAVNGLTEDSVVLVSSLMSVDVRIVLDRIGSLEEGDIRRLSDSLRNYLAV